MNDEILTSISNPIPADLCAYPLQHMYHSKRFWIKRGKLKRSFERLGHGILFVHSWICLDAWRPWTEGESDVSRWVTLAKLISFSFCAFFFFKKMESFPGIRNMFSSCCRVDCRGTIVEFLMGVAIRNHLFTSRHHIKSWKMFKDWLVNKKGEAAGNDWNSIWNSSNSSVVNT